MKPIDWTKPLRTVDGHFPVRVVCTDRKHTTYPIVILIPKCGNEEWILAVSPEDGNFSSEHRPIVENVPERKRGWINIYENGDIFLHPSRILADDSMRTDRKRIACIEIEYEEGEGL